MSEETKKPADEKQAGATAPAPEKGASSEKTFTQAELDTIIEKRLARAIPDDYEDLKKLAAKVEAQDQEKKSELEKALEAASAAEAKAGTAIADANVRLIQAGIIQEAAAQNAADTETVVALLRESQDIKITDAGAVEGAAEAVKALLEAKPFLVKGSGGLPARSGGEFGGNDASTLSTRIAEAESKGDWDLSRLLKLERLRRK